MANLPEVSNFDPGVYEIQTTDLVEGGISGPANASPINLTNRTRWLFDQNTTTQATLATHTSQIGTINGQITTINGQITGINANLSSINSQLPLLAPLASPGFTGVPTAPTPGSFVNNAQIATTAYVFNWFAPLASPSLTGTPTAPTPGSVINTAQIATTAYIFAHYAPINSPVFTGSPNAPTQAVGDSTTLLATTAFVNRGSSLNQNGYRKNPDSTIDQWGIAVGGASSTVVQINITFPITFPTNCWNAVCSSKRGTNGTLPSGFVQNTSNTAGTTLGTSGIKVSVDTDTDGVNRGFWRAIGN